MATLIIHNRQGKKAEELPLEDKIFGQPVNNGVLYQAVLMYNANVRQGNASTKERGSVSGGGKKPWRQKGTGRARQGSTRSPLWVHGGVVFGPHPRDFSYSLPRQTLRVALRESLNAKYQAKMLFCIEDIKEKCEKTKDFAKIVKVFDLKGRVLALLDGCDASVSRAGRNLAKFNVMLAEEATAYDILKHQTLFVTKTALKKLLKRVK